MKILIVDDEADIQPLFLQKFRKEIRSGELNFFFAQSGEEAIELFNEKASEVILILSDINMPGMSGLDLLRHIKERHPDRPPFVMMITAYGDERNRKDSLALGADDFLTKPLDFSGLKERLKHLNTNG